MIDEKAAFEIRIKLFNLKDEVKVEMKIKPNKKTKLK